MSNKINTPFLKGNVLEGRDPIKNVENSKGYISLSQTKAIEQDVSKPFSNRKLKHIKIKTVLALTVTVTTQTLDQEYERYFPLMDLVSQRFQTKPSACQEDIKGDKTVGTDISYAKQATEKETTS